METVRMIVLTTENKSEFIEKLKQALHEKFGDELPENYGTLHPWSLISLIESDTIDSYQLLYINDKFWMASGGMIREFNGEKVYQAGFRAFKSASNNSKGLSFKTFIHDNNTKFQIERAKQQGCKSVILSFNDYNERLFRLTYQYILPKVFPKDTFVPSDTLIPFNGVPQWILTMKLE